MLYNIWVCYFVCMYIKVPVHVYHDCQNNTGIDSQTDRQTFFIAFSGDSSYIGHTIVVTEYFVKIK